MSNGIRVKKAHKEHLAPYTVDMLEEGDFIPSSIKMVSGTVCIVPEGSEAYKDEYEYWYHGTCISYHSRWRERFLDGPWYVGKVSDYISFKSLKDAKDHIDFINRLKCEDGKGEIR